MLFIEYHKKYPSHGYRWLNAKIRLDTGIVHSDPYAYKCCRACRYKKAGRNTTAIKNQAIRTGCFRTCFSPAFSRIRADAVHSERHDGVLLQRDVLRTHVVHGPVEQRNSEPCVVFKTRRQDDIYKRFRRTDKNQRKRNGMADDTAFRPGRGICVQEIQRHTSAFTT